jgi:uncharacterized membrane protein
VPTKELTPAVPTGGQDKGIASRGRLLRGELLFVFALAGLWSLVIGWLAIARHQAFNSGYDLGTFVQVVWATGQGRPFFTSMTGETTNFLGLHFTPLLAVLAPFYRIWPDARLLLMVQTVALACGAVPLFAFARPRLGLRPALLVTLVYFLYPPLHYVALFDFHAIALAVPLLMAAGAALLNERPRATVIWLSLALLAKEEVALIGVGFGLYALLIQRRWRFGAALTAGATLWTLLLFGLVMPALNQAASGYVFIRRYRTLGETPGQMIRTLLTRPESVVQVVATRSKATFLWQLLAPLAGLPLIGFPAVLLTLPTLAYLLLSDYVFQTSIRYHYTAPLIPFLLLSTVIALQKLWARNQRFGRYGGVVLLAAALASIWWWSPLPGGRVYEPTTFAVTDEDRAVRTLLATIPPDAAVASDWAYLPWLANRWQLDTLLAPPDPLTAPTIPPDYLLTRTPGPGAVSAPNYPWVIEDHPGRPPRVPRFAPDKVTPGGLVLWKKLDPGHDVVMSRYEVPFERGLILVAAGTPPGAPAWGPVIKAEQGRTLPVWMAWTARQPLDRRITFTLHLVGDLDRPLAQVDQEMGTGHFPTTLWHEWMDAPVVVGEFRLSIPSHLSPGRYRLLVGAYESETVVPLVSLEGNQLFELATLEVSQPAQPSVPGTVWEARREGVEHRSHQAMRYGGVACLIPGACVTQSAPAQRVSQPLASRASSWPLPWSVTAGLGRRH